MGKRLSPFHPRTSVLCESFLWKDWNGHASVRRFDAHSEQEYYGVRRAAGLLDVSPFNKLDVRGPDGGRLLSRLFTRDIASHGVGRASYCMLVDERGKALDDCVVARIGPEHWRVTANDAWLHWFARASRGLRVDVEDTTHALGALAVQGPAAADILRPLLSFDPGAMKYFRVRTMELAGRVVQVSRTGFTGDLGFEIWVRPQDALPVWDAVVEAGTPHGLVPFGLDALDVLRLEAGFILAGVDYQSSRRCLVEGRKSSPDECGVGWAVDLEREIRFVGQDAVEEERRRGSTWAMVGLDVDVAALESLYEEHGLPPRLAPEACRDPVPVYSADGQAQVGQVTSTTWSPLLKRYLCLGQVVAACGATGTRLRVEHTVDFARRQLPCTVVERPFFDPERKRNSRGADAA